MMAVLLDMPFGISLPSEARCRLRTEFVHAPERARDPDDARAVLETLHADPRRVERGADRHRPVVRQQPSHVPCQMRLEPHLAGHVAWLLANHGAVTVGATLDAAWIRMESLEHGARIIWIARTLGRVNELSPEAVARLETQPDRAREERDG